MRKASADMRSRAARVAAALASQGQRSDSTAELLSPRNSNNDNNDINNTSHGGVVTFTLSPTSSSSTLLSSSTNITLTEAAAATSSPTQGRTISTSSNLGRTISTSSNQTSGGVVRKQNAEKMGVVEDYKGISVEDPDEFYATSDSNDERLSSDIDNSDNEGEEGAAPSSSSPHPERFPQLHIDRPAMHQKHFHERLQYEPRKRKTVRSRCLQAAKSVRDFSVTNFLFSVIPILDWLPKYEWKKDFPSELSAGLTVAVMHIPQGMAYAFLASVDPIVGIYTAFFPVITYICLGTARHVSVGTFAVVSLLVAKPVHTYAIVEDPFIRAGGLNSTHHYTDEEISQGYTPIQVVSAVTFMVGIFQLIFCLLHMGALCALLSHPLIRGFTTGAAIHVLTSQIKDVLGLKIPRYEGAFYIFKIYIYVFEHITSTNLVTLAISVFVIVSLELYSHFLESRLTKLLRGIHLPVHLILVILGILVSWGLDLHVSYKVRVVNHVDKGLPTPFFPPVELFQKVAVDALIIAIITNVVIYSLGLLYATKYQYKVSADQEFLAQGISNVFGSLFSSLPLSGSLSRSSVQEKAGGRTMMTSAVSVFLLLFVLLFAGPVFYHLPNAVLAAIIIQALKGMFKQFSDLPPLFERSFSDFSIWLITFVATVVLEVTYGLVVGISVNFIMLLYWAIYPKVLLLAETDYKDLNVHPEFFHDAHEIGKYVILRVLGNINFSNSPRMQEEIEHTLDNLIKNPEVKTKPKYLILDLIGVPQIDLSGCVSLMSIHKNLRSKKIRLAIVAPSGILWRKFELCGVFDEIHRHRCYPTLQDAFTILRHKEKRTT